MKLLTILLSTVSLLFAKTMFAQLPPADQIETNNGSLTIQPVYHAGLILTWNGKTIYVDPYHAIEAYDTASAADLIFITDIHQDHFDWSTLKSLKTSTTTFVMPQAVAEQVPPEFKSKIVVLGNGEHATELGIPITAIAMYNLPNDAIAKHPKGRGNGYLLQFGNKKIYISGDTEDIAEMRSLTNIDVAFICMNLPYTMTIDKAAAAVLAFKPQIVYPYHYRNKEGFSDVAKFKKMVVDQNAAIDVRLRNWYAEPQ